MEPLKPSDIQPLADYRSHRQAVQKQMIAIRRERRVALGERISLAFENRDTVRYQIHEMCHAESLSTGDQVAAELAVYNQLIPPPGSLSATLMIEIPELEAIKRILDTMIGLDRPGVLTMRVGPHLVPATWEPGHSKEDRIAAVHYVQFALGSEALRAFLGDAPVVVVAAHPAYQATAAIAGPTRQELMRDLI